MQQWTLLLIKSDIAIMAVEGVEIFVVLLFYCVINTKWGKQSA